MATGKPRITAMTGKRGFAGIKVTTKNMKFAESELRQAAIRANDLRPVLGIAAADMMTLIDDSFRLERSPSGEPWEELSEATTYKRTLDALYGRHRGKTKKTKDMTTADKAARTRKKVRGLTRKQSKKASAAAFTMKILQDTSRLRRSWFARAGKDHIKFGSNVIYAGIHQGGGEDVPARPMAPVEWLGGQWKLMNKGPAKRYFDKLSTTVQEYVSPKN